MNKTELQDNKIRVAFVIQDMFFLGAQYVTSLIAKGLSKSGYAIDIVVSGVHKKVASSYPGLYPFKVPASAHIVNLPYLKAFLNIFPLVGYYKRVKPRIVIAMSSNYFIAAIIASRLISNPPAVVNVVHNGDIGVLPIRNTKSSYFAKGIDFLNKWCYKYVHMVVAVSCGVAFDLGKLYNISKDKIRVIYNPVVDEEFKQKTLLSPDHPWLISHEIPVIVAAGALVSIKGFDLLLKAFALVRKEHLCRLIIFGIGKEMPNLKKMADELSIAKDVSFPGYSYNLPANFKASDCFVLSSHCESFSIVLVEALAAGTPVVSTNCPYGPKEILADGKYGILVEPNNPDKLAKGILEVLNGKRSEPPIDSWKNFALEPVLKQYVAMINDIIENEHL